MVCGFRGLEMADVIVFDLDLHPGEFATELVGQPIRVVLGDQRCAVLADVHSFICRAHEWHGLVDPFLRDDGAVDENGASATSARSAAIEVELVLDGCGCPLFVRGR
jgi:hypothetical protein